MSTFLVRLDRPQNQPRRHSTLRHWSVMSSSCASNSLTTSVHFCDIFCLIYSLIELAPRHTAQNPQKCHRIHNSHKGFVPVKRKQKPSMPRDKESSAENKYSTVQNRKVTFIPPSTSSTVVHTIIHHHVL